MDLTQSLMSFLDSFSTPRLFATVAAIALVGSACSSTSRTAMPTVNYVDLDRFMGDWYVIANIPTRFERGAHNAVESYRLNDDGVIETTFTFRSKSFDGPLKTMKPKGFVENRTTNAEWRMQFIWPFKSEYLIIYLDDDYSTTMVGRSKRDYLWIMAKTPAIPNTLMDELVAEAVSLGYDSDLIQMVPQQWQEDATD